MSRVVYKYKLDSTSVLLLPMGSQVVHVGLDNRNYKSIWILQDTSKDKIEYTFVIRGTGHEVEDNLWHVGTIPEHPFIWHVFQKL